MGNLKLLSAGVVFLASVVAGPVIAADLAVKAPVVAEPAPLYSWTGCYVGAHAGYGWGTSGWTFQHDSFWSVGRGQTINTQPAGGFGGGQIGFNYQAGLWLVGIEGTVAAADIRETVKSPFLPPVVYGGDRESTKIKSLYTVAGRVGMVWDRILVYGKGGWAGGQVELSARTDYGGGAAWSQSKSRSGWVAGVGAEYMLTPNFILGLEYNYIDFGSQTYSALNTGPAGVGFLPRDTKVKGSTHFNTVAARVSYRFN